MLVLRSRDIYWYRMDIDNWMLVQVETMCFQWETMTPDLCWIVWTHDIASYASPDTTYVVRRFVVPKIAQNCKWIYSLKLFSCLLLFAIRGCLLVPFSGLFSTEYGMELVLTCVWKCGTSCVWVMAWALVGPKPLPQPQDVILIFVMESCFCEMKAK